MRPPTPTPRGRSSRSRVFTIGAVLTIIFSAIGYLAFRSYIYGDDAPPIPLFDEIGD